MEYTQEAERLVASVQKVSAAAKSLGIVEQTLANWVKAGRLRQLHGLSSEQLSAERMEVIRLSAELTRVTTERDMLVVEIRAVYAAARGAFGRPRVWRQLKVLGICVGKSRVQRMMQREGLRAGDFMVSAPNTV